TVNAYKPTLTSPDKDKEGFYKDLDYLNNSSVTNSSFWKISMPEWGQTATTETEFLGNTGMIFKMAPLPEPYKVLSAGLTTVCNLNLAPLHLKQPRKSFNIRRL
ncbi:hypothetical protein E2320_021505, partial [Naja naja]